MIDETMQAFMEFVNSGISLNDPFTETTFVNRWTEKQYNPVRLMLLFTNLVHFGFIKEHPLTLINNQQAYYVNPHIIRLLRYLDDPVRVVQD